MEEEKRRGRGKKNKKKTMTTTIVVFSGVALKPLFLNATLKHHLEGYRNCDPPPSMWTRCIQTLHQVKVTFGCESLWISNSTELHLSKYPKLKLFFWSPYAAQLL